MAKRGTEILFLSEDETAQEEETLELAMKAAQEL